ncbi:MAG: GNAT family N-acetyltransferase [Armatimonadetes bacterium]|nr:GNAT family N-acetyltransferase [Armatimonadota bacterium]
MHASGSQSQDNSLQVEVLTSPEQVEAIRAEYDLLFTRSGSVSPHLTLEWLLPWYQVYGADYDLHFLTVRDAARHLIAAAPLMMGQERWRFLSRRVVRFLATGPGLRGQFFACPADAEYRESALEAIAQHLVTLLDRCDLVILDHLSPLADGKALLGALQQQPTIDLLLTSGEPVIYGDLPASFEEYVQSVHNKNRRNYLRRGERLLADANSQLHWEECTRLEDLETYLEQLASLSIERQATKGRISTWTKDQAWTARRLIFSAFLQRGWLRLERLLHEDQPIAARAGFVCGDTYFANQAGFDQKFHQLRPSHILYGRRIRNSIEEGLRHFCFGPGYADYKREYFSGILPDTSVTILPKGGPGRRKEATRLFLQSLRPVHRP